MGGGLAKSVGDENAVDQPLGIGGGTASDLQLNVAGDAVE
jgi:hypothetical protein